MASAVSSARSSAEPSAPGTTPTVTAVPSTSISAVSNSPAATCTSRATGSCDSQMRRPPPSSRGSSWSPDMRTTRSSGADTLIVVSATALAVVSPETSTNGSTGPSHAGLPGQEGEAAGPPRHVVVDAETVEAGRRALGRQPEREVHLDVDGLPRGHRSAQVHPVEPSGSARLGVGVHVGAPGHVRAAHGVHAQLVARRLRGVGDQPEPQLLHRQVGGEGDGLGPGDRPPVVLEPEVQVDHRPVGIGHRPFRRRALGRRAGAPDVITPGGGAPGEQDQGADGQRRPAECDRIGGLLHRVCPPSRGRPGPAWSGLPAATPAGANVGNRTVRVQRLPRGNSRT